MRLGKSWPTSNGGGSTEAAGLKRAKKKTTEPRFERKLPDARRKALIEATIECLKKFGHDGLSIRRISAQAEVSIGLINHHFPTKDALVAEAYRYFNTELVGYLQRAIADKTGSPRQQLRAFFEASFSPPNLDSDVL